VCRVGVGVGVRLRFIDGSTVARLSVGEGLPTCWFGASIPFSQVGIELSISLDCTAVYDPLRY